MITQMSEVAAICLGVANCVLKGELTLEEFRSHWPLEADKDRLLWRFMHAVEHFLIDEDIRAKDPSYDVYQRKVIASLATDVSKKYKVVRSGEIGG